MPRVSIVSKLSTGGNSVLTSLSVYEDTYTDKAPSAR